jgi:hypothetical protein
VDDEDDAVKDSAAARRDLNEESAGTGDAAATRDADGAANCSQPPPTRARAASVATRKVLASSELQHAVIAYGSTLKSAAGLVVAAAKLLDADGRAYALLGVCRAIPSTALERRPEWCHDREAMMLACSKSSILLEKATEFLRDDEALVSAAVGACDFNEASLKYASERLRGDERLVTLACKRNGLNLEHASQAMKATKSVVLAAVAEWGTALEYASYELRDDRDVVLQACSPNVSLCDDDYDDAGLDKGPLTYASDRFRADREIALLAVRGHGSSLQLLSVKMFDDEEIVRAAAKSCMCDWLMDQCSERLCDNPEFVMDLLTGEKYDMDDRDHFVQMISERLRNDRKFMRRIMDGFDDGRFLAFCSAQLRSDRGVALLALHYDEGFMGSAAFVLENLSPALQDDAAIVLVAVSKDSAALAYASERLRADRFVCMEVINATEEPTASEPPFYTSRQERSFDTSRQNHPLKYMSISLRSDRAFVVAAVKKNGFALRHASAHLRASHEVCIAAVTQHGQALEVCALAQRDDPLVVHAALRKSAAAFVYASERLRGDAETVELAIHQAGTAWRTKILLHMAPAMRRVAELVGRMVCTWQL